MRPYWIVLCIAVAIFAADTNALTHQEAFRLLQAAGISTSSSGGCSDKNNPRCTSLEQMRVNTVAGLIALRETSGCVVVVTGGTEVGHTHPPSGQYTHMNGFKADIRINPCLDTHITTRFQFMGNRDDGAPMYKTPSGDIYSYEGNRWDGLYY